MPAPSAEATVRFDDGCLRIDGALVRAAVPGLWGRVHALHPAAIDLAGVTRVDSAGLALLGALVARVPGVAVLGDPPGLSELRAAYRLDAGFGLPA